MQQLLLLHGALGSAENFQSLASLLQNDFDIHTLTFEGHGGKDIPENDFSIAQFAQEVIIYLDENKIDSIPIFGYSMGGYVGLYLAKHFPERISKLFTLATKINWTKEGAAKDAGMLIPKVIIEKVPKYAAALETLHGKNWEILMQKTAQMMLDLGENPLLTSSDFESITTPVLLSVGDKDMMVTVEETLAVFKTLSNAQLLVMPNTIHPIEKVVTTDLAFHLKSYFKNPTF